MLIDNPDNNSRMSGLWPVRQGREVFGNAARVPQGKEAHTISGCEQLSLFRLIFVSPADSFSNVPQRLDEEMMCL